MLADSHCHLHLMDLTPYDGSLARAIEAAKQHDVQHILNVCVALSEVDTITSIIDQYPGVVGSVGVHPSEKPATEPEVAQLVELAAHPKIVAVGETGLDYHYNHEGLDKMRQRFKKHIDAAAEINKPIIVHSRAANEDTMDMLRYAQQKGVTGVMHCFTETLALARVALECDFYLSFSGIITFKNASNVVAVAKEIPLERLMIETDAPYLTPVPFRGKPNGPEFVRFTAQKIAEIKQVTLTEVANVTTRNYLSCFKLNGG